MNNDLTRRGANALLLGGLAAAFLPARAALALNTSQAEALVGRLLGEINGVINSGRSENQMFGDFERIFAKYADVPIIARVGSGRGCPQRQFGADARLYHRLSRLPGAQVWPPFPRTYRRTYRGEERQAGKDLP